MLQHGLPQLKKEVPTLEQFSSRFLDGYARANRQKPSGIAAKETILRVHLIPLLGTKKLDAITNEGVQGLKHALREKSSKTVNNVLTVLNKLLKTAVEWSAIERHLKGRRVLCSDDGQSLTQREVQGLVRPVPPDARTSAPSAYTSATSWQRLPRPQKTSTRQGESWLRGLATNSIWSSPGRLDSEPKRGVGWIRNPTRPFKFCKLQNLQCRHCRECQRCRGALHLVAPRGLALHGHCCAPCRMRTT